MKVLIIGGETVMIDDMDFAKIAKWKWHISDKGYAKGFRVKVGNPNGRRISMHRLIMGKEPKRGMVVDHINQDKLDNRRFNLRWASLSLNGHNSSVNKGGISKR